MIEEIDACDNGIDIADDPKYHVSSNLSQRIAHLRTNFKGPDDQKFRQAMAIVIGEFVEVANATLKSWLPSRNLFIKVWWFINHRILS